MVSLAADGKVYLNDTKFSSSALQEKLRAILQERPDRQVFLRADAAVPYGDVMKLMSSVREAGVVRLGMVTEPPAER